MGSRRRCCCSGGCSVKFLVTVCGRGVGGATVTVKSGGTTIGTCTTSSLVGALGTCSITIPSSGTYTVEVTGVTGCPSYSQSMTLTCGVQTNIAPCGNNCSSCLPTSNLTVSWTGGPGPFSGTLVYALVGGQPTWNYNNACYPSSCIQAASLSCTPDGTIYFQFRVFISGGSYTCSTCNLPSGAGQGDFVITSLTCGASPVITFGLSSSASPSGPCWQLFNVFGYGNIEVTL